MRKEDRPKKAVFPVASGRKLHAGVSLGTKGVCLHLMKKKPNREASTGLGEECPCSFILVAAVEQPSRAEMSWE